MNTDRLRPPSGCEDLALWLSGVVNDALRDAEEAGLPTREARRIVRILGRDEVAEAEDRLLRENHRCAVRFIGQPAVCVYLADGTKIIVARAADTRGAAWLEHRPQAVVRPQEAKR